MAINTDGVKQHAKENKGTYMINLFGSVIPIIMFLIYAATQIESLASEKEVSRLITIHSESEMHSGIQEDLGSIKMYLIAERIEDLCKIKCRTPSAPVDDTIRKLIQDYDVISDTSYKRLSCLELGEV